MRTHTTAGCPLAVSVTVPFGAVRVEVRADVEAASLTLAPQNGTDTAACSALADAAITEDGGVLTVAVPARPPAFRHTGFATTLIAGRDGQTVQSTGDVTTVNGRVIGEAGAVRVPTGGVEAVLVVPASSRLLLEVGTGTISARGPAGQITAAVHNGSVQIEHADTVVTEVVSGSVQLGVVENVEATVATFGSIQIGRVTGSAVLRTAHGAIRAHATTRDVSAYSASGEVEISTAAATVPPDSAVTVHGLARVR